ncbi:E2F transcription factor-like E2FF, partial [Camellia lanceoleosa]
GRISGFRRLFPFDDVHLSLFRVVFIYKLVNICTQFINENFLFGQSRYSRKGFNPETALQRWFPSRAYLFGVRSSLGGLACSSEDLQVEPLVLSVENRKEISLGLLIKNFVKLFICSHEDSISLDNAATALLGDIHDPTAMRTKVRRLYDIANVFSSMNLIEKTQHPESRKPAFRWLGINGGSKNGPTSLKFDNSKRRVFGPKITNTFSKKSKFESSIDCNSNEKADMPMLMKHNNSKDKHDRSSFEQKGRYSSKGFVFGPFTPASVPKVGDSGNKNERRVKDLEDLASYHPQYHNQGFVSVAALSDLFAHYVAAWKSWNVKVDEKKQMQEVS